MVLFSGECFTEDFYIARMRNLISIDIMDRLPWATDTSLRADLSRIKFYRNISVYYARVLWLMIHTLNHIGKM